jgi:hypothetical protein
MNTGLLLLSLAMACLSQTTLYCFRGSSLIGSPDFSNGDLTAVNCGTLSTGPNNLCCEYKESATGYEGYVSSCSNEIIYGNDRVDPSWKNVRCCNDANYCNVPASPPSVPKQEEELQPNPSTASSATSDVALPALGACVIVGSVLAQLFRMFA